MNKSVPARCSERGEAARAEAQSLLGLGAALAVLVGAVVISWHILWMPGFLTLNLSAALALAAFYLAARFGPFVWLLPVAYAIVDARNARRIAFAKKCLFVDIEDTTGIWFGACIEFGCNIANPAEVTSIGPHSAIGDRVTFASSAVIGAHVTIGNGATIGDETVLEDGVTVGPRAYLVHTHVESDATISARARLIGCKVGSRVRVPPHRCFRGRTLSVNYDVDASPARS